MRILFALIVSVVTFGQPSVINFGTSDSNTDAATTWSITWGQSCTENNVCTPGTPVPTTAGHGLVCSASVQTGSDSTTSITDNLGQTWTRMDSGVGAFSGHYYATYYIHSSASITTTTINTAPSPIVLLCEEVNATLTLDKHTFNGGNGFHSGACTNCAWSTGTTATTSTANEFLWANCGMTTSDFVTPTLPNALTAGQITPDDSNSFDGWRVLSATGAQVASSTYATSPNVPECGGDCGSELVCAIETFTYSGAPAPAGSSISGGFKATAGTKIQ